MLDQPQPERLDVIDRVLLGQRIDRVAHGVGGQQAGVVPLDVGGLKLALELDADREIAQIVSVGPARDVDQANLGLSVPGLTQNDRHPSAPSICAVSKRAEEQWHVVVLLAIGDDEGHRHFGVEARLAIRAEIGPGVEGQPVASILKRR